MFWGRVGVGGVVGGSGRASGGAGGQDLFGPSVVGRSAEGARMERCCCQKRNSPRVNLECFLLKRNKLYLSKMDAHSLPLLKDCSFSKVGVRAEHLISRRSNFSAPSVFLTEAEGEGRASGGPRPDREKGRKDDPVKKKEDPTAILLFYNHSLKSKAMCV